MQEGTRDRGELAELACELTARSTRFRRSLPDGVVIALSELVRCMSCYNRNLTEGYDTRAIDIECALNEDYSTDPEKRDLQLEARAHIAVQKWMDEGGFEGKGTSFAGVVKIHRRFCERLPEDLLWVEYPETKERGKITPGKLRRRYVKAGGHIPVNPDALPRLMQRFEDAYEKLGRPDSIIASATAHHRLLWLHPFLDGDGLMSYAMLRDTLDTGGI